MRVAPTKKKATRSAPAPKPSRRLGPPDIKGSRVRGLREGRGWTLVDASHACKLAPSQIWEIEHDRKQVWTFVAVLLADGLETSLDYLCGRTDDPSPPTPPKKPKP